MTPEADHFKLRLARLQPSELWANQALHDDEFCFVFFKGGIGKYVTPTAAQRLVPGNILVFSGHTGGKLYADDKGACVFTSFTLFFEHLFPLFASSEISLLHNIKANLKATRVLPQNNAVAVECHQLIEVAQTQSRLEQRANLLKIAASILSDELKNVHTQRSGGNWAGDHMIHVFEKLSSAELLNLSVDELAAKFGCSRRHLNRLFHQHFGLSITALRMEIRLLKAVYLLRNPQEKVINVADQCGFNHLGLFNTCFKKRYGTTPGQWRKSAFSPEDTKKNQGKQTCPLQANGLCPWGGQSDAQNIQRTQPPGNAAKTARDPAAPNTSGSSVPISAIGPAATRSQPGTDT